MDIVPIQLSLTRGDLITLWAPRWREGGEEWEGFLGDEHGVHAFPDAGTLTAYVRTVAEHDLSDHPAWPLVHQLTAPELVPAEDHCYDVVGVPEIAADEPDTWMVGELAGITAVIRALADTCGLRTVHEVLDSAEGFNILDRGTWAFSGREGSKLWEQLADTIATRWDEVIDALDGIVLVPDVDPDAVAIARKEFSDAVIAGRADAEDSDEPTDADTFWEEVGIDPIQISFDEGDYYTLRCYLDDQPLFLGAAGRIRAFPSTRALARYLGGPGTAGHDLTRTSTWSQVVLKAVAGDLQIDVDPQNIYQLSGLAEQLAAGPAQVDPSQLDLGVELLLDVGEWASDDSASIALSPSQSLGWLTSFVLRPDPTRLAPSPPFDAEASRWAGLVTNLAKRMR